MEKKANIILTTYFSEISKLLSPIELPMNQFKIKLVEVIEENKRLKMVLQNNKKNK
jgi:hypothetical protein